MCTLLHTPDRTVWAKYVAGITTSNQKANKAPARARSGGHLTPVMYNGVRYNSIKAAADAHNINYKCLCRRLNSENFPEIYRA